MFKKRTSVREARKQISAILASGKTATVGSRYELRGFIVGIPQHDQWSTAKKKKALRAAKKAFLAALDAESE